MELALRRIAADFKNSTTVSNRGHIMRIAAVIILAGGFGGCGMAAKVEGLRIVEALVPPNGMSRTRRKHAMGFGWRWRLTSANMTTYRPICGALRQEPNVLPTSM
jgi:hypothetical protein